jgi:hypothetical protein
MADHVTHSQNTEMLEILPAAAAAAAAVTGGEEEVR